MAIRANAASRRNRDQHSSPTPTERAIARARQSFTSGESTVQGVGPKILAPWSRFRDKYDVDPWLRAAPDAAEYSEHRFDQDMVLTRLGGLAATATRDLGRTPESSRSPTATAGSWRRFAPGMMGDPLFVFALPQQ